MSLDIPEDLRVVLKELARKSGMSFSQFVSIALEDCIRKDIKLEDSIRKMATLASGEEFNRVGDISEPVRSPLPKNKGEKGF